MQIEVFKLPKMGGPDFWGTNDVWQVTMIDESQQVDQQGYGKLTNARFDTIFSGPNAERRARSYVALWGEALRNKGGFVTDFVIK